MDYVTVTAPYIKKFHNMKISQITKSKKLGFLSTKYGGFIVLNTGQTVYIGTIIDSVSSV
jgi:hypothetical protein